MWHDPLQQGAVQTQNPTTKFKMALTVITRSNAVNNKAMKSIQQRVSVIGTLPSLPVIDGWTPNNPPGPGLCTYPSFDRASPPPHHPPPRF